MLGKLASTEMPKRKRKVDVAFAVARIRGICEVDVLMDALASIDDHRPAAERPDLGTACLRRVCGFFGHEGDGWIGQYAFHPTEADFAARAEMLEETGLQRDEWHHMVKLEFGFSLMQAGIIDECLELVEEYPAHAPLQEAAFCLLESVIERLELGSSSAEEGDTVLTETIAQRAAAAAVCAIRTHAVQVPPEWEASLDRPAGLQVCVNAAQVLWKLLEVESLDGATIAEAAGSVGALELVLKHYSAPFDHPADLLGSEVLDKIEAALVELCDALGARAQGG